jgi:hypothetical protein
MYNQSRSQIPERLKWTGIFKYPSRRRFKKFLNWPWIFRRLIDVLKSRQIPITIEAEFTASEMDDIEKDLEQEGLLCS